MLLIGKRIGLAVTAVLMLLSACSSDTAEPTQMEPETKQEEVKQSKDKETQSTKEEEQSDEEQPDAEEQSTDEEPQTDDSQKANGEAESSKKGELATVTRVVDGDTLEIQMNGEEEQVRLLLVDTPETKHPSKPVEPFGPEASEFVKEQLSGEEVRIVPGTERYDNYDRLLAYVFIDGETIQEKLLRNGLARTAYLYNDLTMLDDFHEAQQIAQDKDIGVWSIDGYAHADHDHGYHYDEEETSGEKEKDSSSNDSGHDHYSHMEEDHDCGDFNSADEATEFMNKSIEAGYGDHRLDGDGDGVACEG
ncbi:thermonuclease family protein [Piscibacillus sp. B03]|uniref:thermonuclease family protein n=1 Tax=Piscibacillus sp. B03 TaxID=3457430 RepID=UPI003FCCC5EC